MNAPGILHSLCPHYDARERHEVIVAAPATTVRAALESTDFAHLPLLRALLALRSMPFLFSRRRGAGRAPSFEMGIDSILAAGFGLIERDSDEIVLGLGGPFWELRPTVFALDSHSARHGPPPGTAHALWNFSVESIGPETARLSTETRVLAGDVASRRRFRVYWFVVRPFSGLIRRMLLRAVRRTAESAHLRHRR